MANEYYDHGSFPSTGSQGSSAAMRAEMDAIEVGFDKLPVLAGNGGKPIRVKADASGMEAGYVALATDVSGALPVSNGGTNLTTYAAGDIIYASATDTLAKLPKAAAGSVLLSGDTPSWGKVALATHVSGTLPVANGGTGATTLTSGGLVRGNGTSALSIASAADIVAAIGSTAVQKATSAFSGPDGSQLAGFRNLLMNGGGQLSQRGLSTALTAGGVYGSDRWIHYCAGATGITAACASDVSGLGGTRSKNYIYISGSWTAGAPGFAQRIEAVNTYHLAGKTVTLSGKIYQNSGSPISFNAVLKKANTADAFGTQTTIATVALGSVASNVVTPFSATFTLGATDAANGLQIGIEATSTVTVTSKTFGITDMQLEEGSIATPFEQRPIGLELALCQRYYQKLTNLYMYAIISAFASRRYYTPRPVMMRATPVENGTINQGTVVFNGDSAMIGVSSDDAVTTTGSIITNYTASAEL